MAKFETKVCMCNQYGDVLFELECDENGYFYKLPTEAYNWLFDVGDKYFVKEIETEVE